LPSPATALKRVLDKTGKRRQAGLVALVSRIAVLLPGKKDPG